MPGIPLYYSESPTKAKLRQCDLSSSQPASLHCFSWISQHICHWNQFLKWYVTSCIENAVWFPSNLIQAPPLHFSCSELMTKDTFSTWRQHKWSWRIKPTLFSILLSFHTDLGSDKDHKFGWCCTWGNRPQANVTAPLAIKGWEIHKQILETMSYTLACAVV